MYSTLNFNWYWLIKIFPHSNTFRKTSNYHLKEGKSVYWLLAKSVDELATMLANDRLTTFGNNVGLWSFNYILFCFFSTCGQSLNSPTPVTWRYKCLQQKETSTLSISFSTGASLVISCPQPHRCKHEKLLIVFHSPAVIKYVFEYFSTVTQSLAITCPVTQNGIYLCNTATLALSLPVATVTGGSGNGNCSLIQHNFCEFWSRRKQSSNGYL